MKKILALLLALVMMMSLVACGSDVGFKRGVIDDNVYTQEAFGLTFTAPEGYKFFSDEQLAATYGTTPEVLKANTAIIYDMQCGNLATNGSISIIYEDLASIYGTVIDDDSYLTLNMASIKTSFDGMEGIKITAMDKDVIEIDGTEYNGINITLNANGTNFYETVFVKEIDGYMMCCTAAAYDEAELSSIIDAIDIA